MMKQLTIWNVGTAVFGAFIVWMLVKQLLPASISVGGSMLLFIGLFSAGAIILGGEILIKKLALEQTSEKTVRLVSIILGLIVATMTVANVWTWALPNLGGVSGAIQGIPNVFNMTTLTIIVLMGIVLNGLYWEMKDGKGIIAKTVFRGAVILLILGVLLTWLIGDQLISQSGKALQDGTRSQLSALLNGQQPTSGFEISWSSLALGLLALFFVFGLIKYEIIKKTTGLAATVLMLPLIIWFAWGALPAEFKQDVREVTESITPDFIQITPAQKEARRKAQEAERKVRAEELRLQAELDGKRQAAYEKELAKDAPLTAAAFTTKTIGTFAPIKIKSGERIGPINAYKKTCFHWDKSGMGMFFVYSRTDFVSEPVTAEFADSGYSINEWGHAGAPVQLFLEARGGDIQIELERYDC